jgi:LmbE family N-acetylglucosaminyl deacetylase
MIFFREKFNPDLVIIPSVNDLHQDHSTIANEAVRAFKFSNILSYEMPWNNLNFNTTFFSIVNLEDMETKIKALKSYQSQNHRPYANEDFIWSLGKVRGIQINSDYAEVFEVVRLKL